MRNLFLASLVAVVAAACGGSVSGNGGDGNVDAACTQYAAVYRSLGERCPELTGVRWSQLEPRMHAACNSALTLPGTAITADAIRACGAAMDKAGCNVELADIPECNFGPGKLAVGDSCVKDDQCASQSCASHDSGCGKCEARVAIGGSCSSLERCVEGAVCSAAKCVAVKKVGEGEACNLSEVACAAGLHCNGTTCTAPGAEGANCDSSSGCKAGLACDFASSKCAAITAVDEGGACSATARCKADLECDASKCVRTIWRKGGEDCGPPPIRCEHGSCNPTTNKCPVLIPDGQPCTSDSSKGVCDDFAECSGGKCALLGDTVCK